MVLSNCLKIRKSQAQIVLALFLEEIMAIKKTKSGHYRVEVFYPQDLRLLMGVTEQRFRKTVDTKQEANKLEKDIKNKIQKSKLEKTARNLEYKGNISFADFYHKEWLDAYKAGATGRTRQVPSAITIRNTEDLFRIHLLPLFGKYSMKYLNDNKDLVMKAMIEKSLVYANIKYLKGYVTQMFELAEIRDFIDINRIDKVMKHISEPKKQALKKQRLRDGQALTALQLLDWLQAVDQDFKAGIISIQDYTLFQLTLNIGDRKSESYALQWKHVDFKNNTISLIQSKDGLGNIKDTKGHKRTKLIVDQDLMTLLLNWKKVQKKELAEVGIKTSGEQYLFTYTTRDGKINEPVHVDYLNYRMNSTQRRHPNLVHASPHKLRHTFSTLAKEGGATKEEISEALTHSDVSTTEVYINTETVVGMSTYNKFRKRLLDAEKTNN